MAYKINPFTTNFDYYETGTGSTVSQDLDSVLTTGNNAGSNDIDLNNNDLLNTDKIDFNTATADTAGVGQLVWNDTDGTLDLGLKGGNVTLQVGQEQVVRIVNKTNTNLLEAEYKVVRIRTKLEGGAQGQRLAVVLAQADTGENHSGILGIVTENINNNQEGFITTFGFVRNIDTTGNLQLESWSDGDVLYLSETVAGGLTNIEPTTHPVKVGWVAYAHQNNGKIFVKVQEGVDELHELHDVKYPTTLANNEILQYNLSQTRWENKKFPVEIQVACSDETTAITAGTGKVTFRMPHAMTVTSVRASLTTAQASGNIFTVDINEGGVSILSTKLTIDNTEKTSVTALTAPVISDTTLADDAEITIDVDQIGNGTATGLKVTIIGYR